jgi:predicted RNase H-like HicB family nuclease
LLLDVRCTVDHASWPEQQAGTHAAMMPRGGARMRSWKIVIERDAQTGLYVGYVPGWPGAHSQGETIDELKKSLAEVISMLLVDGEPALESEYVDTQTVQAG